MVRASLGYNRLFDSDRAADHLDLLLSSLDQERDFAEVDAATEQAKVELEGADGKIQEVQGAYQQAVEELDTKLELQRRNASTVAQREIEKLQDVVDSRQGGVATAIASKKSIQTQIASLLPAQKASAEAARAEVQVELDKTVVHAMIDGMIEQFTLKKATLSTR